MQRGAVAAARRRSPALPPLLPLLATLTHHFSLQLLIPHGLRQLHVVHLLGLQRGKQRTTGRVGAARRPWPHLASSTHPNKDIGRREAVPERRQRPGREAPAATHPCGCCGRLCRRRHERIGCHDCPPTRLYRAEPLSGSAARQAVDPNAASRVEATEQDGQLRWGARCMPGHLCPAGCGRSAERPAKAVDCTQPLHLLCANSHLNQLSAKQSPPPKVLSPSSRTPESQ